MFFPSEPHYIYHMIFRYSWLRPFSYGFPGFPPLPYGISHGFPRRGAVSLRILPDMEKLPEETGRCDSVWIECGISGK